jgi:hypothetical protein
MNRVLRVLLLLVWLELGLLLILVPWSNYWEANYFLNRFPGLIPFLLNPFLRGAVSGLGLLDAVLAAETFRRRATAIVARD